MMNQKDQMFWSYNTVQRLPYISKTQRFITGSNVFHLNNIKSSDKMN